MFTRENGEPWHPDRITKLFSDAIKEAKAPSIRLARPPPHLRHHGAEAGVHVKVVSECLGHKEVQITLATYSHVTADIQEASLCLMDAYTAAGKQS